MISYIIIDMECVLDIKGFKNLGNTCYMNSGLQSLLASDVLNRVIMSLLEKKQNMNIKIMSPMLIEYCRLILELSKKGNTQEVYPPVKFKNALNMANSWFKGNSQHDTNEFLLFLINNFIDKTQDEDISGMIKKTCFGKYKQYICCNECKNIVSNNFNFLDITLPIPKIKNPNLETCFMEFAKHEVLDGTNSWNCPNCKKKVTAHKKMELSEVPDVAIFTFNRFNGMVKNNTQITLYPFIELDGKKLKLVSTVNHYGGTNGGHYIANVNRNDIWYKVDDSSTSKININKILNDESVYIAVYQIV